MPINEQLSFSVSFGGNVKASATATINDTSRPAYEYMLVGSNPSTTEITEIDIPTYTLASNKTSVNEGETITFTLSTTMLDTGTSVPYTISGVSVSDISLSSLTGNFITDATGKATLTLSLIEDALTEGTETLTISINGQSATRSVTINDTSLTIPVNSATFISEYYSDSSQQLWGYTFNTNLGTELTDNIKINDVLVDLGICDFSTNVAGTGNGILSVWVAATVSFNYNVIKAKCTNTSSGLTYTSVAMQPILVGPNGTGWFANVADADLTKLKTIFADGQTVRLELILE